MRRIAIINQKGGVGKTTTTANLGAALAIQGRRVVLIDMDAQANLSLALGVEARSGSPTVYSVLTGEASVAECLRATKVPGLSLLPSNIDLSGAEMELAGAMGREFLLRDALKEWNDAHEKAHGKPAADYVLFDCPPSLGLLSINALSSAGEVLITLQTEFLAMQGMSKLVEIVALLKKRLNPDLVVVGILPTLYDSRLKLAREVLGEIRRYFKDQVMPHPIRANVKLAEAPSFAQTIFEYAPDSHGALDYVHLAQQIVALESRDASLAGLKPFDAEARLPVASTAAPKRMPPPRRKAADTIVPVPARAATPEAAKEREPVASASVAREARMQETAPAAQSPSKPAARNGAAAKPEPVPLVASKKNVPKSASRTSVDPLPPEPVPTTTKASKTVAAAAHMPKIGTAKIGAEKPGARKSVTSKPADEKIAAAKPAAEKATAAAPKKLPEKQKNAAEKIAPKTTDRPAETKSTKPVQQNGAHATLVAEKPIPSLPPRTQSKTLKPVPRTARTEDVPPLPPDAFEILSTPIDT